MQAKLLYVSDFLNTCRVGGPMATNIMISINTLVLLGVYGWACHVRYGFRYCHIHESAGN